MPVHTVIYKCLLIFNPDTFIFCSSNCLDENYFILQIKQLSCQFFVIISPRNLSRKVLQKNAALCIMKC